MTAQEAIAKIREIVAASNLEDDDEKLRQIRAVVTETRLPARTSAHHGVTAALGIALPVAVSLLPGVGPVLQDIGGVHGLVAVGAAIASLVHFVRHRGDL